MKIKITKELRDSMIDHSPINNVMEEVVYPDVGEYLELPDSVTVSYKGRVYGVSLFVLAQEIVQNDSGE